jgi:elongation factor 2
MMKKFTQEEVEQMMKVQNNIRNISVIAHVDHGKSTLSDSLVAAAGLMNKLQVGEKRILDTRDDEILRCITIKSTSISLGYEYQKPELEKCSKDQTGAKEPYVINLIDTPGHVDFSSEVTTALRVTDGAIVVVDCIEGVCVQTEVVLRQAIEESIKPVLMINKIDRAFKELNLSSEECYQIFFKLVESLNAIISSYSDDETLLIDPTSGNCAFGSGKLGFGFTLTKFAQFYSNKMDIPLNKLMKKFWGENYFDHERNVWQTSDTSKSGKKLKRGFCEFCLDPIRKIFSQVEKEDEKLTNTLQKYEIKIKEKSTDKKELLKSILMEFLPASDALIEMTINHLPSPIASQQYRYKKLYTGDLEDKYATSIKNCDPEGPLMIYISKMIPSSGSKGRFIAFGRIFSGTVTSTTKLRIMRPDDPNNQNDLSIVTPQRILLMMGKFNAPMESCVAGNVVGITGIDKFINKTCTLTEDKCKDASPIGELNFSVSPVVKIAIRAADPSQQMELIEGMKKLSNSDSLVECTMDEETGELIVAGAGELHIEICLNDLENYYCKGIKIIKSKPAVTFVETVTKQSNECLSKSPNKLNRIYISCEPLDEDLVKELETNTFNDFKKLSKLLTSNYNWNPENAKKIWAIGPNSKGTNLLVDCTKGVDYINDVKDHIINAFQEVVRSGVLCEEQLRGVRFNVCDLKIHSDSTHRGSRQITPAAKRAMYASQLSASPRLMQPIFKVDIQSPEECLGGIYSLVSKRKGIIYGTEKKTNSPLFVVQSLIPVLNSFGLTKDLRSQTSGRAFPQCVFEKFEIMDIDPFEKNEILTIIQGVRERKKLKETEIPPISRYLDKL